MSQLGDNWEEINHREGVAKLEAIRNAIGALSKVSQSSRVKSSRRLLKVTQPIIYAAERRSPIRHIMQVRIFTHNSTFNIFDNIQLKL